MNKGDVYDRGRYEIKNTGGGKSSFLLSVRSRTTVVESLHQCKT